MRHIELIVVHCSATPPSMHLTADRVREWHIGKGWSDIGYHYFIQRTGQVEAGRPEERIGAHTKGHNRHSLGVCLAGGVDEDGKPDSNFTAAQYRALDALLKSLCEKYPDAIVRGHREFSSKACPSFDAGAYWHGQDIGALGV